MTEIVDRPHLQPLSLFGRGEKNVDRENLKIGIIIKNLDYFEFFVGDRSVQFHHTIIKNENRVRLLSN
ncbi:hypothetical protein NIES593_13450 [Hydrococcus rivularis NIES-593]|uniref:Uncharacterized protein n=1 Tax=Hydrococcus rivularis NIES-593 TaxID=1921803 RepID=A0A1U7HF43_9CYAN|nr:hypothetical protein [Hydrococcus rivularis]OKH22196.1 hypothetical protein NIES593_13450 [Hydrococcus rivularis NIES-593]